MSDFEFEARLERLFAQPPRVTDHAVFCRQVQGRLDSDWTLRRTLIGTAGVIGGLLATTQAFGSGVLDRLSELRLPKVAMFDDPAVRSALTGDGLGALAAGGEVVWVAAAMMVLAVAFTVTQVIDRA